jgi:predicted nucleic acid-binding protein
VKIVIDSYAWIEHFIGSIKGQKVDEILENADEVYTPDIVLAEVARKYIREGIIPKIIEQRLEEIAEASNIICIDTKIAVTAAKSYQEIEINAQKLKLNSPSLFDAIVLATGKSLNAKIMTGDQHFKNLPDTIWIE